MGNPIMDVFGKTNPFMQMISQMFGIFQAAKDPQATLQQMSQNDSRMKQVQDVINQNGGDAKAAFYNLARQKGVDPDTFIQQMQGMMK